MYVKYKHSKCSTYTETSVKLAVLIFLSKWTEDTSLSFNFEKFKIYFALTLLSFALLTIAKCDWIKPQYKQIAPRRMTFCLK